MKGIRFSSNESIVIHKNSHEYEMWYLRKEFEQLLLIQAVVESYCNPCDLTKYNIYKSKP